MTARRWFVCCAAVAVLFAPFLWNAFAAAPDGVRRAGGVSPLIRRAVGDKTLDQGADAPRSPAAQLVGTPSCSARGCHGAVDPVTSRPAPDCLDKIDPASLPVVRQNEFSLWLARDKHAQAYQVLDGDLGRRILKNLYGADKAQWDESACLACHTNPLAAAESSVLKQERLSGVGCESCHGAAAQWLDAHTKPEWMCKTREEKNAYGMKPMGDPVALAQTCVGCHVGAPPTDGAPVRDMNHDMIAAGHPRLDFELSAFLANMPPHWDEKSQAKHHGADYEARVWAVGQVVTAQAALELLTDRARNADSPLSEISISGSNINIRATPAARSANRPWPEFSEYNCYACHHALTDPSWRQTRGYGDRKAGSLPWGTWYSVMPRRLAGQAPFGDANDQTIAKGFDALEKAMAAPQKDRSDIPARAQELAKRLTPLLTKTSQTKLSRKEIQMLLSSLAAKEPSDSAPDWDAAEQLYLAAAALSQDQGAEQSSEKLNGLVKMLAVPRTFSPEDFNKAFNPSLKGLIEK
jgi:Cytochrome c554 and c-prime